jgi:hypothetical protein
VRALRPKRLIPPAPYIAERYVPYQLLWAKVIIRAAYDFALWKESDDLRLRNYAKDAERWLFGDSGLSNSFDRICEVLNIDGARIRKYAKELTRDQVKKLEFMEREGRDPMRLALGLEQDDGDAQ